MKHTIQKISLAILCATFLNLNVKAQQNDNYTRWSFGTGMGVPVTLFSVNSMPVGIYNVNARYAFGPHWSFEGKVTSNIFFNNQTGINIDPNATLPASGLLTGNQIVRYRTAMYGLHGIGYYNLSKLFNLKEKPNSNWVPYLNFGGGLHLYKLDYTAINGSGGKMDGYAPKPARDYQLGLGTRYYINHNLDVNFGAEYHYVETKWLDSAPGDGKLDNFINLYGTVSWKIGAKPWKNHADWYFKNSDEPKELKKNYAKWSIDLNTGLPFMISPVPYKFTGMFGAGLRHSFSKSFAIGAYYNYGVLGGSQSVTSVPVGTPRTLKADQVKDVSTTLNQLTVRGFFNLRNLRTEPETMRKWNHYLVVGAGLIYASQDVTYSDGGSYSGSLGNSSVKNFVVGYQAKKYLTPNFDLTMGVDLSNNQTKWFDAAPIGKDYDNSHIYTNIGVAYKIGAKKERENIDWSYQGYSNYHEQGVPIEKVPVVVKQEPTPVDTSRVVEVPVTKEIKEAPVEVPVVKEVPKSVEPVIEKVETKPEVKVEPKPIVKAEPKPKSIILDQPKAAEPNKDGDITPPPMMYNVIVACYNVGNERVAQSFKNKLEQKGYKPSLYRDSGSSRMIRLSIISTNDKAEALQVMRKARKEIDPYSWIHLYNKQ